MDLEDHRVSVHFVNLAIRLVLSELLPGLIRLMSKTNFEGFVTRCISTALVKKVAGTAREELIVVGVTLVLDQINLRLERGRGRQSLIASVHHRT